MLFYIAIMLFTCGMIAYKVNINKKGFSRSTYEITKPEYLHISDPNKHIGEDYMVDNDFSSHLPLVILDTGGTEPPIHVEYHKDEDYDGGGYNVQKKGVEPYKKGTIAIINNNGINQINDTPQYEGNISIKRRGNSSAFYEKAQWLVKLTDSAGNETPADILGMGEGNEWILNGSMTDKSMIRNYLAYSVISKIMPYTPDSKYCEVLFKTEHGYEYHGVYLMMENIKRGKTRVNIMDQKSDDIYNSYILKRDRYDAQDKQLENYGRLNGLSKEYISIVYPSKKKITEEKEEYINADINKIEQIIYSDDPEVFATYKDVIDVNSFVDYFIVNEFFGNYDAGNHSTYFYKDKGGKLCMGPVWDFDGAMDNYRFEPFDMSNIAFSSKPWYDRLCQDKRFLKRLEQRYIALRKTYLSDRFIEYEIDNTIHYLNDAIDREWYRWGDYYNKNNKYSLYDYETEDGTILYRDAKEYKDEIYRIKSMLYEHARYIYPDIRQLEDTARFDTGIDGTAGWILLLVFIAFSIPAILAVRKD